jgi:hypothetical protein
VDSSALCSNRLIVFIEESDSFFAVIQSRVHQVWADFFGGSHEDRPFYTPSDCFDNFSLPREWNECDELGDIGKRYYDDRRDLMVKNDEGLTKTYNRFHDPDETSPEIKKFRELHDEMDRAVMKAYGWNDLAARAKCDFLLDYEEEDNDESGAKKSKKKKPWRLRWPDDFRDEVLARLLELNEQRAMEEKLTGKTSEAQAKKSAGSNSKGRKSSKKQQEPELFE